MLILKWQPDDDGTGELFVEASANGFSGRGKAWFDSISLTEEAEKFAQFPLPEHSAPVITGGFWDRDNPDELKQEHVFIKAEPFGIHGQVAIQVRLASEVWPNERMGSQNRVVLEFETTYEELRKFPHKFKALLMGEVSEIVVEEKKA